MGFPSTKMEGVYRNNMVDVARYSNIVEHNVYAVDSLINSIKIAT